MRRVAGGTKTNNGGGNEATPETTQAKVSTGPRMQSAAQFYQLLGERHFNGDASKPVDANVLATVLTPERFQEMTARVRDDEVRKAATDTSLSVTPERVFKAWATLLAEDAKNQPNAPADHDAAFVDYVALGEKVLQAMRDQPSVSFRNRPTSTIDAIGKIGVYEPELLLARELATHAALGGSDILARALDRCYVPADLRQALKDQAGTIAEVKSAIPKAPAALQQVRLDDLSVIDSVMQADPTYVNQLVHARQALARNREAPRLALNLRDQIQGPVGLLEVFGRLGKTLSADDFGPEARELLLMVARLATSSEVTSTVKEAAFVGIDQSLKRIGKKGAHANFAAALFGARNRFSDEVAAATHNRTSPEHAQLMRDAIDSLTAEVFKQTRDASFAAQTMAAASDPGAILLRSVLDAKTRDDLVSAAMRANSTPATRGAQIALIGDKAKRQAELAKLLSATPDFRPTAESAALLLSWPAGTRPGLTPEARAERARDLQGLGGAKLEALMDSGASEHLILKELMTLGASTSFNVGADDLTVDETVAKIIRGQIQPEKKGWSPLSRDTLTPLLQSPAIAALPMQMKHGASENDVKNSLIRAIRAQNGLLLMEDRGLRALLKPPTSLKLQTVLDALEYVGPVDPNDKSKNPRTLSAIDTGVNVVFGYRVLVECSIAFDGAADAQIHEAARKLLRRTGVVSLAPYAGMSAEENAVLVTMPPRPTDASKIDPTKAYGLRPDSPQYLSLLDTMTLPPTVYADIAMRSDLADFPAATLFEILSRAVDNKSVTSLNLANLTVAATTSRATPNGDISATNVWATFNDLASRNLGKDFGKLVLAGLSDKADIDVVYRAAATLAAEGKLFDANQVAEAVMALVHDKSQALINELGGQATTFVDALDVPTRAKLIGRVLKNLETSTDASVLDMARPCFKRLAELTSAGHKLSADVTKSLEAIVINAAARIAKNPMEAAALGPIFAEAQASGVDIDKVAETILTNGKNKALASLTPGQLAAVRFEVARLVPSCQEEDIKKAIPAGKVDVGPYMAAFELLLERNLSPDVAQQLARAAIGWAAEQRGFARVVDTRKKLMDAGADYRLAAFDAALTSAMQADPNTWSAVPEARELGAMSKLIELRNEIVQLAAGGKDADGRARILADRIAAVGPYASELAPQVLAALRREVRALRPSLDDIQVALDVATGPSAGANKPAHKGNKFFGLELPEYTGERNHADVPEALTFVPTPTSMNNTKRLIEAMASDYGVIIVLGPPGPGKTYTTKVLAHHMGAPLVEMDGGPERRVDEAQGTYKTDKEGVPVYERSKEIEVYARGGIIVDDEFQASRPWVLNFRAEQAARSNKQLVLRTDAAEYVARNPATKILLLGNFLEKDIPEDLRRHAKVVYFDALPAGDQVMIARTYAPSLPEEELQKLGEMQQLVEALYNSGRIGTGLALSVRNLTRAAKRAEAFRDKPEMAAAIAARESYIDGVADPTVKAELVKAFVEIFKIPVEDTMPKPAEIHVAQGPRSVSIGEVVLDHGPITPVEPASLIAEGNDVPFIVADREKTLLLQLAKGRKNVENTLFYAETESGLIGTIEAFSQLVGETLTVKECNREMLPVELFGEPLMRKDENGKPKNDFANGFINDRAVKNGGIIVLRNIERLKDSTRIALHRMLQERRIPVENGVFVDLHPNAQIIMTTTPGEAVGDALQNRCTPVHLKAKTQADMLERLLAMGDKLGVPRDIVTQMVRFDGIWKKMINNVICQYVQRHNLPMPGMDSMVKWLRDFASVVNGTSRLPGDMNQQINMTFIQGGLSYYGVPSSRQYDANRQVLMTDNERVEAVLRAIAEGNDHEIPKLAPNCE